MREGPTNLQTRPCDFSQFQIPEFGRQTHCCQNSRQCSKDTRCIMKCKVYCSKESRLHYRNSTYCQCSFIQVQIHCYSKLSQSRTCWLESKGGHQLLQKMKRGIQKSQHVLNSNKRPKVLCMTFTVDTPSNSK